MGKHKKFQRKEKSKVKFKTKKTVLTKAQNITDTSFKVRKIVIKEQLKSGSLNEALTRKKHNVKELLSRLQHHNMSMRKDSLDGLRELVTYHSEDLLGVHLSELIEGVAQLILDQEKDIRKNSVRLLGIILTQVPTSKIAPFFNVLLSYLCCGMTHIHTSIQDDSLDMFDTLLISTPLLIAANCNKIFPKFLNMISNQKTNSKSERTLTLNLSSRFTSIKWRIKVLHRLHDLLAAMVMHEKEQNRKIMGKYGDSLEDSTNSNERVTWHWRNDAELHIPIHSQYYRQTCNLSNILGSGNNVCERISLSTDEGHIKSYAKMLMPLLMETWLEVGPGLDSKTSNSEESFIVLTEEAAQLLKCVLEIIQLLYELLQMLEVPSEGAHFITSYRKDFVRVFFPGFPYTCTQTVGKKHRPKEGKKSKRECDGRKPSIQGSLNLDPKCLDQNLAVCHLFCCFYDEQHVNVQLCLPVLNYVKRNLKNWKHQNSGHQMMQVLRHLLLKCSKYWLEHDIDMGELLDSVITYYMKTLEQDLFLLLSDIALNPACTHLHRCTSFQHWLKSLPDLLCSPIIPITTVKMLGKLACQNNPVFYFSLCCKLPDILDNLGSVNVTDAENDYEGKKSICNILYWIKEWPQDAVKSLKMHLDCAHWNKQLATHITDLLELRGCSVLNPPVEYKV